MIPAEVKKRENIAEYIIHMYQTEDLIATYDFNLDEILTYVIKHMSQEEETLKELLLWYANIIDEMRQEQLPEQGRRLKSTQQYVDQLSNIHNNEMAANLDYKALFKASENEIHNQINLSEGLVSNPVQVCLNAVYGRLVINLNGKSLPREHEEMVERFGKILSHLTKEYHKSE